MAENRKCLKVVGKVFLMIKNGPGFMVSQMHSLFNVVVDNRTKDLTYGIATQSLSQVTNYMGITSYHRDLLFCY